MDRAIPEINRHIVHRMRKDHQVRHKSTLRSVRSTVDNGMPEALYHPIVKAKPNMMIEGKSPIVLLILKLCYVDRKVHTD